MKSFYAMLVVGVVAVFSMSSPAAADAPRGFIGDDGTTWDTQSAVSVDVSWYHPGTPMWPDNLIDGSGLDPTGLTHNTDRANMWKVYTFMPDPDRPHPYWQYEYAGAARYTGVVTGEHGIDTAPGSSIAWAEFSLDQVYELGDMWVWNYAESWEEWGDWTFHGMQGIEVHATSITDTLVGSPTYGKGSNDPDDWTLIYQGDLACAEAGYLENKEVSQIIDFGGFAAQHIVITCAPGFLTDDGPFTEHDLNWSEEKTGEWNDGQGLSEVRFYEIPEPATMILLGLGGLALRRRR